MKIQKTLFKDSSVVSGIGMRVKALDFTRATEQTSIFMSRFACMREGRGVSKITDQDTNVHKKASKQVIQDKPKRQLPELLERSAFGLLLGYIQDTGGHTKIVHSGPYINGNKNLLRHGIDFGRNIGGKSEEWQFEIATCPIDGVFEMSAGYDHGSISALACAPWDTFVLPGFEQAPKNTKKHLSHYFVVVVDLEESSYEILPKTLNNDSVKLLDEVVLEYNLVQQLEKSKKQGYIQSRLTINTMLNADVATKKDFSMLRLRAALRRDAKVRTLYGSSIIASIAPLLPKSSVDAFVGVLNPTQTLIMAVATQATTTGQMYALPVFFSGQAGCPFEVPAYSKVWRAKEFVQNKDAFMVATGITGSEILKGVQFSHENCVNTQTLCLRTLTKSYRIINHRHVLTKRWIRFIGKPQDEGGHYRSLAALYNDSVKYFDEKESTWIE